MIKIRVTEEEHKLLQSIVSSYGFFDGEQARILSHNEYLKNSLMCLIRCNTVRLITTLRDVMAVVDIITREGTDHVRDVSLTTETIEMLKQARYVFV